MAAQSRRKFLQHGSMGVAVGAGAVLMPALLPGTAAAATAAVVPAAAPGLTAPGLAGGLAAKGALPDTPLTAYVKDHRTGDVAVMVGEREIVHRDPELANLLARIATHAA